MNENRWETGCEVQDRYARSDQLNGEPETFSTICKYCGMEIPATLWGECETTTHPGGLCPKTPVFAVGGDVLSLEEFRALTRVARAQIEMEKRRGVNQR